MEDSSKKYQSSEFIYEKPLEGQGGATSLTNVTICVYLLYKLFDVADYSEACEP